MKKILALVLALAMVALCGAAFAATIEVKNVIDNETYTAYKILNYTQNGTAVSYYLSSEEYANIGSTLESAGFSFTASSDGTQYFLNNSASVDVAAVAEYLGEHTAELGSALGTATATGASGSANFTGLTTGYYFVTSSAGSLCALHSENDIATAVEKNTIPGEDKKQSKTDSDYADAELDMNIGDTVYYQVEITDGKGTNGAITLTDTMTAGLTYQNDATVYFNNEQVVAGENTFSLTNGNPETGFTIVLAPAYVAGLAENDVVIVKYTAKINENAVINDVNTNTVTLDYSEQRFTDHTDVKTYDFIVYKTDGTNFLDGAEFKLYDAAEDGNQILIADDGNGRYHKDLTASPDVTIDINSATGCNVRGLEPGTYYLEEVVVPNGYNKLSERKAVTITSGQTASVEITVVNNAGSQLPSTGGIGTTIFYILGGLLVVGAAVILVARRKAQD